MELARFGKEISRLADGVARQGDIHAGDYNCHNGFNVQVDDKSGRELRGATTAAACTLADGIEFQAMRPLIVASW